MEQHVVFPASTRVRATSFWQVLIFLLEASVLILIGFSLRDVVAHGPGLVALADDLLVPLAIIIATLTLARFVWIFGSDGLVRLLHRLGISREQPMGAASCTVVSWAGMRGVVTLAAALTLPTDFPSRDFILLAAFGVILVTVLIQGTTLGAIIKLLGVHRTADDEAPLDLFVAEQAMMKAQLAAVEKLARDDHGNVIHPQLLRRYTARATVVETFTGSAAERDEAIAAHFDVIIGAVAAGRDELLRLHRSHMIDDETLRSLEHDLDLEELSAAAAKT